jgi:hypothetical protein
VTRKNTVPPQHSGRRVSVERTLDSWPLWVPADSRTKAVTRYIERKTNLPDGTVGTSSVYVDAIPRFGLLTTEDQKVLYALLKLWEDAGRPEILYFSLRQLALTLKRSWGKQQREDLKRSLDRLASTSLTWDQAFYDSRTKKFLSVEDKFRIIDRLRVVHRSDSKTTKTDCEVQFHEITLANLRNFHTRPVLLDTVLSFESGVAQLLYRYADPLLFAVPKITRKSVGLFADLGLDAPSYRKKAERRRLLERALKELDGALLSDESVLRCSLGEAKDGDILVSFEKTLTPKAKTAKPERQSPPMLPAAKDEADVLVRFFHHIFFNLRESQVSPGAKELTQARSLVKKHGLEAARHVVEFALVEAKRSNFVIASFGGILQYTDRALAALGALQAAQPTPETSACTLCESRGWFLIRWPDGRTGDMPCPHDSAKLNSWVAERGLTILGIPATQGWGEEIVDESDAL